MSDTKTELTLVTSECSCTRVYKFYVALYYTKIYLSIYGFQLNRKIFRRKFCINLFRKKQIRQNNKKCKIIRNFSQNSALFYSLLFTKFIFAKKFANWNWSGNFAFSFDGNLIFKATLLTLDTYLLFFFKLQLNITLMLQNYGFFKRSSHFNEGLLVLKNPKRNINKSLSFF